jgi:YggT family protein
MVFALALLAVRWAFLVAAALLAVVSLVDWLARTRRINPFGRAARWTRSTVDPLLAPIERRVLRAGGNPQQTPWWTLVAVVLGGIIVISLLEFVGGQILALHAAASAGPRGILRFVVSALFAVMQVALLARVLSSWFPISPSSRWIRWSYVLTEPILRPLRQVVPALGPIDITPLIAYFLIRIVGGFVVGRM